MSDNRIFQIKNHPVTDSGTVIDCLHQMVEESLSKGQLKNALSKGAVWLSSGGKHRRIRRAKHQLKSGDMISLFYNQHILDSETFSADLVADNGDYSVWNKPAGMFSQPSKWADHTSIVRFAEMHLQPHRSCFLVHRLDRATCGLILIAHNKKVATILARQFESRQIKKTYRALVPGESQLPRVIDNPVDGKSATTQVSHQIFHPSLNCTELLLKPLTGRKHQIRQHLAELGFPIIGDRLYGGSLTETPNQYQDLCLQACEIAIGSEKTETGQQYHQQYQLSACPFIPGADLDDKPLPAPQPDERR